VLDIGWKWLGRVSYAEALKRQRARRQAVIREELPETLWLLEHNPVITTGRRPVHSLPSTTSLAEEGIELHRTERGGLATWHGPGQIVAYAIIDAWGRGLGARGTIGALEEGVIQWLHEQDISANRRPGFPGVWVDNDKICAIGMHFSRGVSMHGIALNLEPDMRGYSFITPCGIHDAGVTSVARLRGSAPTALSAAPGLAAHLVHALLRPPSSRKVYGING